VLSSSFCSSRYLPIGSNRLHLLAVMVMHAPRSDAFLLMRRIREASMSSRGGEDGVLCCRRIATAVNGLGRWQWCAGEKTCNELYARLLTIFPAAKPGSKYSQRTSPLVCSGSLGNPFAYFSIRARGLPSNSVKAVWGI
jgi:hypothetical protein